MYIIPKRRYLCLKTAHRTATAVAARAVQGNCQLAPRGVGTVYKLCIICLFLDGSPNKTIQIHPMKFGVP